MKGKKTGGRQKGTPNKDTREISEILLEKFPNYHPVIALAGIANDKKVDLNLRLQANKEVAKYICPQLKSIELNSNSNEPRTIRITQQIIHSTVEEMRAAEKRQAEGKCN